MAFCRVGRGSDVYVFLVEGDGGAGYECCACALAVERLASFQCEDVDQLVAHLDDHHRAGHRVPAGTGERARRWHADVAAG